MSRKLGESKRTPDDWKVTTRLPPELKPAFKRWEEAMRKNGALPSLNQLLCDLLEQHLGAFK